MRVDGFKIGDPAQAVTALRQSGQTHIVILSAFVTPAARQRRLNKYLSAIAQTAQRHPFIIEP
jgi:hypothetical protein